MRALPEPPGYVQLEGGTVAVDGHGYLVDPRDWSREFAEHVAREEGIELGRRHWEVIRFMRDYLEEHGIAADARFVLKFLAAPDGLTRHEAKMALFELFPYGYVKQACRIAGMKQPRAWSTG